MRVEETRQVRGVRPGLCCRIWPGPGPRAPGAGCTITRPRAGSWLSSRPTLTCTSSAGSSRTWTSAATAAEPAEDPLQDLPVGPVAFQAGQGGHDVGGDLRPGPEVAVPGVHVGVGDVGGVGAGPDRVVGRDHGQDLLAVQAPELLPDVDPAGQHRLPAQNPVT